MVCLVNLLVFERRLVVISMTAVVGVLVVWYWLMMVLLLCGSVCLVIAADYLVISVFCLFVSG